jgi:alcohol dehydrogenase class IV
MDYQIKPEIKIGNFKEIIYNSELKGNTLILTSKTINSVHEIENSFVGENIKVISSVEPELPFSYIKNLFEDIEVTQDNSVAIGGGSVLDLGKALSVCKNFDELKKLYYNKEDVYTKYSKLYAVPSTFGTGAEMSYGAILYDDEIKQKGGLRNKIIQPNVVIIDSEVYKSAPKKIMAETGFDCLTHAIETYLSSASNKVVKYQSVAAINTVFSHLVPSVLEGSDTSISKMAIASMMMGVNLAYSSTCLPHRIQYIIGPLTNTSHPQGLIVLYRGWLELIAIRKNENTEIQNLLKDLGITFETLINNINTLKQNINIDYRLSDFNINESDIDIIAQKVYGNLSNDPFYEDINSIKFILKNSL